MSLKAQDILILLKLVAINGKPWTYQSLSSDLGISQSQLHLAVKRIVRAGLVIEGNKSIVPNISRFKEFLLHGLKFVFVPERGGLTRGIATSSAAAPLSEYIVDDNEPPPVWPDPEGNTRGYSFSPLHKLVPRAVKNDRKLYELLVLVDALRGGRARERDLAAREIKKRLDAYGKAK